MQIGVQLTGHDNPEDWHFIDSADWMTFAPGRSIFAILGPGTPIPGYDHYAVEDIDGATHITIWNDQPNDTPPVGATPVPTAPDEHYARQYIFHGLKPDIRFGGAYNSKAEHIVFAAPKAMARLNRGQEGVVFLQWANFEIPKNVRDGEWIGDAQAEAHEQAQSKHSWREWIDGVPIHLVRDGKLRPQRAEGLFAKPDGTKTYFLRDTNETQTIHIGAAALSNSLQMSTTAGTGQTVTESIKKADDELAFGWYTPSGEPDSAAWPTTGTYRVQLDASVVGADITFGYASEGGSVGHWARVNTGLTADLSTYSSMSPASHSSPAGLKLSSGSSVDFGTGAASDRFEVLVAAENTNAMTNQDLEMTFDSDAFMDGPWVVADTSAEEAIAAQQQGIPDPPAYLAGPEVIGYEDGGRYDKDD